MTRSTTAAASPGGTLFLWLGVAGLASVSSTRLCDAMLPELARTFDTTTAAAAATISSYGIAYALMLLVFGPLGDRFGKLRVIAYASAGCAVTTTVAALAPTLGTLVVARAVMGAGMAAIVPLTVAWIGDSVAVERRQQTLARFSGFTVMGIVIGPLLGGLLTQVLSWRGAFAVLVPLFAMVSAILITRVRAEPVEPRATAGASTWRQARTVLASPAGRLVMLFGFLEAALGIASLAFVPTVLHTRFGLSALHGGLIAALFGLGGFLFSRSAPQLMPRVGATAMPLMGGCACAAGLATLAVMPHWAWGASGCVAAGFGFFALHNTLQTRALAVAPSATGLTVALFSSSIFAGQAGGVMLGSSVIATQGAGPAFATAAVGMVLLGVAVRVGLPPDPQASPR